MTAKTQAGRLVGLIMLWAVGETYARKYGMFSPWLFAAGYIMLAVELLRVSKRMAVEKVSLLAPPGRRRSRP